MSVPRPRPSPPWWTVTIKITPATFPPMDRTPPIRHLRGTCKKYSEIDGCWGVDELGFIPTGRVLRLSIIGRCPLPPGGEPCRGFASTWGGTSSRGLPFHDLLAGWLRYGVVRIFPRRAPVLLSFPPSEPIEHRWL